MKFRIGDKVSFLDDHGGGIVTKIENDNIVHVEIEDGFEVPVVASNLILVSPMTKYDVPEHVEEMSSQGKSDNEDESVTPLYLTKQKKDLPAEGVYFAIVPENIEKPLAGNLMLYLLNHSDYQVLFSIFTNESGTFHGFDFGYLEPEFKIYLDTIDRSKIENWVNALVQINFFKDGETTILQPLSKLIDFKPVKTYKEDAFKFSDLLGSKAIMVQLGLVKDQTFNPYSQKELINEDLNLLKEKIVSEKKPGRDKPEKKKSFLDKHKVDDKVAEVDLHIHKLLDDFINLENKDLIDIQIDYFKKCLSQASKDKYQKIIFIHGVGDGILKDEINRHLEKTEGVQYYDASYSRYGMGATEVLFYKNK